MVVSQNESRGITVRQLAADEDAIWDALVAEAPTANRFLRSDCLRMLEETDSVGIRFQRMAAFNDSGLLRGGWALPYMQKCGIRASTYFEFFYASPMLVSELETGSVHVCQERLEVLHRLAEAHARRLHFIEAEGHPRLCDVRGIRYAGFEIQTLYTHIWKFGTPDEVLMRMNRERRRLIKRANETYRFRPLSLQDAAQGFIPLYRRLMQKFDWMPGERWSHDLQSRLAWLVEHDVGRGFGAWDDSDQLCGAVIVLLSPEDRTIYLWRCGYDANKTGNTIVPALYWYAAMHWFEQWGKPMACDLGGSPLMSLSLFKDYLGAEVVPHQKLIYRPLRFRPLAWRIARAIKAWSLQKLMRAYFSWKND